MLFDNIDFIEIIKVDFITNNNILYLNINP
jgi:hypothetical protein